PSWHARARTRALRATPTHSAAWRRIGGAMSQLGREEARQALSYVPAGDLWLFITREGSDPAAKLVFDVGVSGEAAFMLHPQRGALALVANYDVGHVERLGVFDELRGYDRSFADGFDRWLEDLAPRKVYLNYSERDILCDGLTHGQFLRVSALLGESAPGAVLESSEPFLRRVRGRKTAEELSRLRVAIAGSVE